MRRTVFLIDGFNLYHSTRDASRDLNGKSTKWLDIRALCRSYLHLIGKDARLQGVYYFSALAKHLEAVDPGKVQRHRTLIKCLEDTGVGIELAKFKRKPDHRCVHCGNKIKQYEEKETDVAVAAKLLELVFTDACDAVVLVTGDTDLAPAVRTAQNSFPEKDIRFALPYKRHNNELRKMAPHSFTIGKEAYLNHQFSDPHQLTSEEMVNKPASW